MKQGVRWIAGLVLAGWSLVVFAQLPDFVELVEAEGHAVVNISTTQKIENNKNIHGFKIPEMPEGTPFDDLFKHFFGEGIPAPEDFDAKSLGSGFIIKLDGEEYVMTNHHVVKNADEIMVKLYDRREMPATLVGSDERSDIALLKIKAEDLPVAKIGDPKELRVGEWVVAMGSPFGFERSVTAGIVSAKGRNLPRENYVPFIQTDVAINPGNSGGPLFNMNGEVVGVNAQIYSRSGGSMGLSFSIPIDVAMDVAHQLKETGHVSRGWLGVLIQDVTQELAESFGMDKPVGALVARVLPGSPAEKGGLKVGDIIIEYNGRKIDTSAMLPPMVGASKANSVNHMLVIRDGKRRNLKVQVGELPTEDEQVAASTQEKVMDNRFAIQVEDLSEQQREQLDLGKTGVMVTDVGDGPARSAGIRRGDVITMMDGQDIKNARHFERLMNEFKEGRKVSVLIHRNTGPTFVVIDVPAK